MSDGCPSIFGFNICTSEDVRAWASALDDQQSLIDQILISQAPSSSDQVRISAMEQQAEAARTSGMGSPRSQVSAYAEAVDLAQCVITLWEGRGDVLRPSNPSDEPQGSDPRIVLPEAPPEIQKSGYPKKLILAVGVFSAVLAFILRGRRG